MNPADWNAQEREAVEIALGYLNFSSGDPATKFLAALNMMCARLEVEKDAADNENKTPAWRRLGEALWNYLKFVQPTSEVFSQDLQVRRALLFGFRYFFPQYRVWHKDLLFHLDDDTLFNAFSIGQAFYAILAERAYETIPENEVDIPSGAVFLEGKGEITPEIQGAVERVIARYDDFIGYRPIPVLRSRQKMQPYRHEWLHAVPLYVKGAGVVHGPYTKMVTKTLEILQNTDEFLLSEAMFDFERLEELTFDPRALDFEHPVNRRLNYHFGSWDPLHITNKGYFDRFVLIRSTILSIFSRVNSELCKEHGISREELEFEASAVLAGTLLMGSAVSGWGPGARTSEDTFASLLPKVAKIRDTFYQNLMGKVPEPHAGRLREEEETLHQPFAAARQYFNRKLAKQRAEQYQNVQLGRLYAWMGYSDASNEMVMKVNVPSTRMRCEIDCLLTQSHLLIDRDAVKEAIPKLYRIEEILHEGIECGAFLDPWYMMGFDGQFPLSMSVEDSTQDQRVDEMTALIGSILALYSRILKETAAKGMEKEQNELMFRMQQITEWWDQFGSLNLSEINSISGVETYESIQLVVTALKAWYEGGTAAGDIAFWRPRVADFSSPKAYTLLIEALLDQKDPIASMALLVNWLSQSELLKLDDGDYSFHPLALRWMEDIWYPPTKEQRVLCRRGDKLQDNWKLAQRFVDLVEANADVYGVAPSLELESAKKSNEKSDGKKKGRNSRGDLDAEGGGIGENGGDGGFDEFSEFGDFKEEFEEESLDDLFNAAWQDVTYHDSTDDGVDGSMMDGEALRHSMEDFPLTSEMERISDRLLFIITQARLWKMASVFSIPFAKEHPERAEVLEGWSTQAEAHLSGLHKLIADVKKFEVEKPDFTRPIAMMEYEKQLGMKFALLERLIATCSELMDAQRLMRIADVENRILEVDTWENATRCIIQSLICGDSQRVRMIWEPAMNLLAQEPILYEPIERGGDPIRMIRIRNILTVIQRLLVNLPIQGLLSETYRVLTIVQQMEREHPIGTRAITRYDALFDLGSKGIFRSILRSASKPGRQKWSPKTLIPLLDGMMEILLKNWISHSHGIRISTMDAFQDPREWNGLKDFIQKYGEDLFASVHMNYSNLQAIHHEGVTAWLQSLEENCNLNENTFFGEENLQGEKLIRDLQAKKYPIFRAERFLEAIVETLIERYGQFIDYSTTTTQSDDGSKLYMLLDFLRLLAQYDRLAWDMRPFINAHREMVYEKNYDVADSWYECVMDRSGYQAKSFIRRYRKLCLKYGMTIKTVGDRLEERMVKPMAINKLCALLVPAIQEAKSGGETPSFTRFLELVRDFTAVPSGTGYEPPSWLEEIENEINRYRNRSEEDDEMLDLKDFIPQNLLKQKEIKDVIAELSRDSASSHGKMLRLRSISSKIRDLDMEEMDDSIQGVINGKVLNISDLEQFLREKLRLQHGNNGSEDDPEDEYSDFMDDSPENEEREDDEFRKLFE
ncbi:MAG: hypothetical protein Q4C70_06810 [Planctomycetia bacterium]|nr:hypothetical protein [Planctomycetia bacterium]